MKISTITPPSQEILSLGFSLVDKIKILGMEIHQSIENLDENFKKIHESIKKSNWLFEPLLTHYATLIKKNRKFSSFVRKFRRDRVQRHI
jgi:hypothetical protein